MTATIIAHMRIIYNIYKTMMNMVQQVTQR